MTNIAITGIGGRMGTHIANIVRNTPGLQLTGGTEAPGSPNVGKETLEGFKIVENLKQCLDTSDVVIDFSAPSATLKHAELCVQKQKAIVIGTTGFSETEKKQLKSLLEKIPSVWAPNMSIGVNVLFKIAAETAKHLGEDYDIEIVEAHHRHKKDAPSGTALGLAESVANAMKYDLKEVACYHREGQTGARPNKEIGIQTIRGGDIVGDHTVFFVGDGERLELTHRATSRDNFARGAVRAAQWLSDQKPGIYTMVDVLGL